MTAAIDVFTWIALVLSAMGLVWSIVFTRRQEAEYRRRSRQSDNAVSPEKTLVEPAPEASSGAL